MRKLLVLGGSGLVGSRVVELLEKDFEIIAPSSEELDLTKVGNFEKYLMQMQDSGQAGMTSKDITIVNFVAYTNVDGAEAETGDEAGLVYQLNALVPKEISALSEKLGFQFIHISTDYVFDGMKETSPYVEEDSTNPLGWYGKTKLFGDQFVLESISKGANAVILRIMMPYGSRSEKKKDLGRILLERLQQGLPIQAISDAKISPVFVDDLAEVIRRIVINVIDGTKWIKGLYHVASADSLTLFEFVKLIGEKAGLSTEHVSSITFDEYWKEKYAKGAAKRPKNSWLDAKKLSNELRMEFVTVENNIEDWLRSE